MDTSTLFMLFDITGTFVFALSGAIAAKESLLDIFGILFVAFLAACGGGIVRDICLGIPPVAMNAWPYIFLTVIAVLVSVIFSKLIMQLSYPVLLFDALGLSIFAIAGTQKTLLLGQNYLFAILLGTLSAIGGGVLRDVLLRKIPVVLRKEVYGSAALIGSVLIVTFDYLSINEAVGAWTGMLVCFMIRLFSLKKKWKLPTFS